jgi:hypothetical protein
MRKLCVATLLLLSVTAAVAHPGSAIAIDRRGVVYFVDTGSGVWTLPPGGTLTRHPGPGFHWMALDPTGKLEKAPLPKTFDAEIRAAGSVLLSSDYPITVGSDGALYFAEFANKQLRMIRFAPDGTRSVRATLPGPSEWIKRNHGRAGRLALLHRAHGGAEGRRTRHRHDPRGEGGGAGLRAHPGR